MSHAASRAVLSLSLAATLSLPAAAEVLDSSPAGFTVRNVVTVPVPPARAWQAMVDDVDRWWPKDHSWFGAAGRFRIEPHAGGCFCEVAGPREALHMQVSFVDPGVALRMIGGLGPLQGMGLHGALDWQFEAVDGGTRITLRYVAGGYTTEDLVAFAPIVDKVQGLQLGGLARFLGAAPAAPPAAPPAGG
jgi:uncharacterized protein YndB with AHSA1/START domain